MTRDDIIRMALEAGFSEWAVGLSEMPAHLERFAALVAAVEREECAKVCENIFQTTPLYTTYAQAAQDCAEAIRARGEQEKQR